MPSSNATVLVTGERRCWLRAALMLCTMLLLPCLAMSRAAAQTQAQGFAVQRLYSSGPGAGWIVMDALDTQGGLGGAVALSGDYAHLPLRLVSQGSSQRLALVSQQVFAQIGVAVSYDRFRLHLSFGNPLVSRGKSGSVAGYRFSAPPLNLGQDPDGISDTSLGLTGRILGNAAGAFRLGLGVQLIIPSGDRVDYVTDGTYRGMVRALVAGDFERLSYAAQLGVHLRPLDDSPIPGSPQGSELLFGAAAAWRWPLPNDSAIGVGPEIFGQSGFRRLFGTRATGLEALLTGRYEGVANAVTDLRIKLGVGGGIHPEFGTPEWRVVVSIEVSARQAERYGSAARTSAQVPAAAIFTKL